MLDNNKVRIAVAAIALSAGGFVASITSEGYSEVAVSPVPGDVATFGFGSTGGDVKQGDRIGGPVKAVQRAYRDLDKAQSAIRRCVRVKLSQGEYDAFVNLTNNIGGEAFCNSTLVKNLNAGDYAAACAEISRWDKFNGRPLMGLTIRRSKERQMCEGKS